MSYAADTSSRLSTDRAHARAMCQAVAAPWTDAVWIGLVA